MTALDFELTDVVTVFAMLLIATVLVRAERDNGCLLYTSCLLVVVVMAVPAFADWTLEPAYAFQLSQNRLNIYGNRCV